jgi:hypothetical protein
MFVFTWEEQGVITEDVNTTVARLSQTFKEAGFEVSQANPDDRNRLGFTVTDTQAGRHFACAVEEAGALPSFSTFPTGSQVLLHVNETTEDAANLFKSDYQVVINKPDRFYYGGASETAEEAKGLAVSLQGAYQDNTEEIAARMTTSMKQPASPPKTWPLTP